MCATRRVRTSDGAERAQDRSAAPKASLSSKAYAALKKRILFSDYTPGSFLQEAAVCADLGLGRTPVRQALLRLHQEGFVEIIPRKGVIVKAETVQQIIEALDTRILVEPFCAGRAAEKANPSHLKDLKKLQASYLAAKDEGDRRRMMIIDQSIHAYICDIAGNPLLRELLRPIHERMTRLWYLPYWHHEDFSTTRGEHDAVLLAIRARDHKSARAAMELHLKSLKARISAAVAGGQFF